MTRFISTAILLTVMTITTLQNITPALAHAGRPADTTYASDHAPTGVKMGHRHKKGEWMFSYRFMTMEMSGSRIGTNGISPETTATTTPNRFFGTPMQPPTLRVVPTDMTMQMHMLGVMYGLTDNITVTAMGMWADREMDHITFQGGMGTTQLGTFQTEASGFGDTIVGVIYGFDDGTKEHRQFNAALGISLPTGSITERDEVLTPTGARPTPRLPYPMQLGTGTVDIMPSLTLRDRQNNLSYGTQIMGTIRLGQNDEGYNLGDKLEASAWLSYEPVPQISFSGRLRGQVAQEVDGIDRTIIAPVQTADPDNQGGTIIEGLVGVNFAGAQGVLKGHRLAIEVGLPLYRDLNGPQLETDLTYTLGWQKAF